MTTALERQNSEGHVLSQSYHKGVKRVTGLGSYGAFHIPPKVLHERHTFWEKFFHKYTEEIDDVELDIRTLQFPVETNIRKSQDKIQCWVNTGYLPYNNECQNVEMKEVVKPENFSKSNEHKKCSSTAERSPNCILPCKDVNIKNNEARLEEDMNIDIVESLLTKGDIGIEVSNENNVSNDKSFIKKSISVKINKKDSLDSQSSACENKYLCEEAALLEDRTPKHNRRKKLYIGRNSPIDIVNVKSSKKDIIPSRQSIHPALHLKPTSSKKSITAKRKKVQNGKVLGNNMTSDGQCNSNVEKSQKLDVLRACEHQHPVVYLKRLSESEIQKHSKAFKTRTNINSMNVIKRTDSSCDLVPETVPSNKDQSNVFERLRLNLSNCLDSTNDIEYDRQTVLRDECDRVTSHDGIFKNVIDVSYDTNSVSSSDSDDNLKAKKHLRKRKGRRQSEVADNEIDETGHEVTQRRKRCSKKYIPEKKKVKIVDNICTTDSTRMIFRHSEEPKSANNNTDINNTKVTSKNSSNNITLKSMVEESDVLMQSDDDIDEFLKLIQRPEEMRKKLFAEYKAQAEIFYSTPKSNKTGQKV